MLFSRRERYSLSEWDYFAKRIAKMVGFFTVCFLIIYYLLAVYGVGKFIFLK
jgi:hypothetical protein